MAAPDNDNDDIKQLYERFKAELGEHADMYYDEDDIIMIFDLAGDYYDRYVQMHALMLGRRLFPDSENLELRLGFAILDMYDDASLDDFLANNANRQGVLWDILRLRGKRVSESKITEKLDDLINRYNFEEDEEIIQFVNLVAAYECEPWLAENCRRFIDRCHYRDTALSECAEALRFHDKKLATSLVEELTRIDAFNSDSWIKLAEMYRDDNNVDEGLSAISYAKALRPDDYLPLYVEATLLTRRNPDSPEAAALLQRVIDMNPEMFDAKVALSDIYDYQGKSDLAEMIWKEELRRNPDNDLAKSRLAMLSPHDTSGEGEDGRPFGEICSEDDLERMLNDYMSPQNNVDFQPEKILNMLSAYDRDKGLYTLAGEYIKLLYQFGRFEELCEFMERERPEGCPEMRLDPPSLPLYAASQLRLGRYDEAARSAREYLLKAAQVCSTVELSMAFAGVKIALNYILLRAIERNYSADRDPVAESLS